MTADGNDIIRLDVVQFVNVLSIETGNINLHLGHDSNRLGVQSVSINVCRVDFSHIAFETTRPTLRLLAAAEIASA